MTLVTAIAILFIGFSIFSAVLVAITHFNKTHYQDLAFSRYMGFIMLTGLCSLQITHFFWLYANQNWVSTGFYKLLLFTIAPAFYLFSQEILINNKQQKPKLIYLAHLIPIAVAPFLCFSRSTILYYITWWCFRDRHRGRHSGAVAGLFTGKIVFQLLFNRNRYGIFSGADRPWP